MPQSSFLKNKGNSKHQNSSESEQTDIKVFNFLHTVCGKDCSVTSRDAWKARMERCVAFNGNYFEGKNTEIK